MVESEIINSYESSIKTGKFTLTVRSVEKYWPGHDSGKMEDMPGTFLEVKLFIENVSKNPSPLEALAAQHHVVLHKTKKEITHEPKGYGEMSHNHFVEKVKKSPDYYLQNMKKAVKDIL